MNVDTFVFGVLPGLVLLLVVVLAGPMRRAAAYRQASDAVDRRDDRYWLGGIVYNNPDDPELFVPKRYVPGGTLNVGHPVGRLIIIGILLLIVVTTILVATGAIPTVGCHPNACGP